MTFMMSLEDCSKQFSVKQRFLTLGICQMVVRVPKQLLPIYVRTKSTLLVEKRHGIISR